MGFNKETAKAAGAKSKRGTNEQVKELRGLFLDVLDNNKSNIQYWIDEVAEKDPAKALELLLKFSTFVIPKPKIQELKEDQEQRKSVRVNFVRTRANTK